MNLVITASVLAATGPIDEGSIAPTDPTLYTDIAEIRIKNSGLLQILDKNSKHYEYDVSQVTTLTVVKTNESVVLTVET